MSGKISAKTKRDIQHFVQPHTVYQAATKFKLSVPIIRAILMKGVKLPPVKKKKFRNIYPYGREKEETRL